MPEQTQPRSSKSGRRSPSLWERLRVAVANRDWLAVLIDLLVVTLGVLIAFEAQQWGEEHGRRAEERALLERLYRETGLGIAELTDLVETHQRGVRELGAVLRAARQPDALRTYAQQEDFGCVIGTLPSAAYNDTAAEELVSRISSISDATLRDEVRELAASQALGSQQLAYSRQNVVGMFPWLLPYYRTELRTGETDTRCTIDWPRLMRNQASVSSLARVYRVQWLMLRVRSDTLELETGLHGNLACRLDQRDCKARH